MKNIALFLSFFLFSSLTLATNTSRTNGLQKIYSSILKEERKYHVYLPPSYGESNARFPVLYVLDGDVHRWKSISGILEGLSTATLDNQIQQAIIVAIPNTNRERDLTPTELAEWKFRGKLLDTFENSGKASIFLRFLAEELIPNINQQFNTSNKRVLVGESFGGLFSAFTLLHKSSIFTDYLIIDPTSLWDNNYLNRTFQKLSFDTSNPKANVFFAFANNSKLGNIGLTNKEWGQAFASKLEAMKSKDLNVEQRYFKDETHGTVAMLGWYYGLKFLLAQHEE